MASNAKVCVWWQGRKAAGGNVPVKRHGVFSRCFETAEINKAIKLAKSIARRRGGGAAVNWESAYGLSQTLLTCFGTRCKSTVFGKKLGIGKGTLPKDWER